MFVPLIQAYPSFGPIWLGLVEEWRSEPELPIYLGLSDLARHLTVLLEREDTLQFPAIFAVIERWHVEGDEYVREAATIGLIENLQNLNIHRTTKPTDFMPWLGPKSCQMWHKVEDFWEKGTIIRNDRSG